MLTELLIPTSTFTVGVLLGFVIGWFVHKHVSRKGIEDWERGLITIVVTTAWAISVVLDVVLLNYETPIAVHAVMGLVVGYFFEGSIKDVFKK